MQVDSSDRGIDRVQHGAQGGPMVLPEAVVSPSLRANGSFLLPAYEMKFLLDAEQAGRIEDWCARNLQRDPHGDPAMDGAYQTTSLYTDTTRWDVFRKSPGYERRKFRVRRYGDLPYLFVERKSKNRNRVWKKRSVIDNDTLILLAAPTSPPDWSGRWFHEQLVRRGLRPSCRVTYHRKAWFGTTPDGLPLRVTIDRNIFGVPCNEWLLQPVREGRELFAGQAIIELKYRSALPALFKQVIAAFSLVPSAASKYRRCCETWGKSLNIQGATSA